MPIDKQRRTQARKARQAAVHLNKTSCGCHDFQPRLTEVEQSPGGGPSNFALVEGRVLCKAPSSTNGSSFAETGSIKRHIAGSFF
ncbi:hypothetical protein OPT61_g5863 [Boeremia exigua]|uniref:Uncharacterized protein n=1 Tax=Boeremia exigua TaxID=749465 RepID=A0ACC2I8R1_9PLEO|nr:hypothetical protein OPT61_g5863 [Boeremia exigua]